MAFLDDAAIQGSDLHSAKGSAAVASTPDGDDKQEEEKDLINKIENHNNHGGDNDGRDSLVDASDDEVAARNAERLIGQLVKGDEADAAPMALSDCPPDGHDHQPNLQHSATPVSDDH